MPSAYVLPAAVTTKKRLKIAAAHARLGMWGAPSHGRLSIGI